MKRLLMYEIPEGVVVTNLNILSKKPLWTIMENKERPLNNMKFKWRISQNKDLNLLHQLLSWGFKDSNLDRTYRVWIFLLIKFSEEINVFV
jgi:hypothetical protein